ncbi:hypothetical protein, partial [Kitasatospora sp. NPDC093558]|uniref:hypothetical protein n=1 Tax=Kitasatospora sp. NPDC093558 TaxID=3155201 RepID=UPI00343438A7
GPDRTWSAQGGAWREVEIVPRPVVIGGLVSQLVILVLLFAGVEAAMLLPHPGYYGVDQTVLALLPVPVFAYLAARWAAANRRLRARPTELSFDGVVLRRWIVTHEDKQGRKSRTHYCAFDDGSSAKAWTFAVGEPTYERLAVGDQVHVEANPRLRRLTAPVRSL